MYAPKRIIHVTLRGRIYSGYFFFFTNPWQIEFLNFSKMFSFFFWPPEGISIKMNFINLDLSLFTWGILFRLRCWVNDPTWQTIHQGDFKNSKNIISPYIKILHIMRALRKIECLCFVALEKILFELYVYCYVYIL